MRTDLTTALKRKLQTHPPRILREAYGFLDPDSGMTGTSGADIYRSDRAGMTDLPERTREDIIKRAFAQYRSTPLARQYVQLMLDIIGSGTWEIQASDERVQALLDEYWYGAYNDWPSWLDPYTRTLMLAGCLAFPFWVNPVSGLVKLGFFNPLDLCGIKARDGNPRHIYSVAIQEQGQALPTWLKVVGAQTDPNKPHHGRLLAEDPKANKSPAGVLYFRSNHLPDTLWGGSDLEAATDYLSMMDQWHSAQIELASFLGRFAGDVEIKDGSPAAIDERAAALRANPMFASVSVHNQFERHNYHALSTQAYDAEARDRIHGTYATTSLAPPHLIRGEMGEGNRAVAKEQSEPFYLRVKAKLDDLKMVITFCLQHQIDSAIIVGALSESTDTAFEVNPPAVLNRDQGQGSETVLRMAQALTMAEQRGWIPASFSRRVFARIMAEVGITDVDPEELEAMLAEEGAANGLPPEVMDALRQRVSPEEAA